MRVSDEFTVAANGIEIGRTRLEYLDAGMGAAFGGFTPDAGHATVKPIFQIFAEASGLEGSDPDRLARYYKARDELTMELRDPEGRDVPTTTIHIADHSRDLGADAFAIEVYAFDRAGWALIARGRDAGEPSAEPDFAG